MAKSADRSSSKHKAASLEEGSLSSGADIFFSKAGLTAAGIRELSTTAHQRAMATILATDKLTPNTARKFSEILKRSEPPFSLASLQALASICQHELTQKRSDETSDNRLTREQRSVDLLVELLSKTFEKDISGQESSAEIKTRKVCYLDKGALDSLLECVEKGPAHSELTFKILAAVSRTSPQGEGEALSLLKTHRGNWNILDRILTTVADTHDLFVAAKRLQILVATEDMKRDFNARQAATSNAETEESKSVQQTSISQPRESVKLASGVVSTSGDLHCFMNIHDPTKCDFLGDFATPHLSETIYSGKYKGKTIERRKEERVRRAHALFEEVTLSDLLQDSSLVHEIKSPLIGRALRVYEELMAEQRRLREELLADAKDLAADRVIKFLSELQLRADPGGHLLSKVNRAISDSIETVPDIVKNAYNNLASPYTELGIDCENPEQQDMLESACWRTLALWLSHQECIRTDLALEPHIEDIKEWKKLRADHPIKERYNSLADLEEILIELKSGKRPVLSRAEYGGILVRHNVFGFRIEMNRLLWEQYGGAAQEALQRFRPLFKDKNRWREDCIPLKVPERVHTSFWGAPLALDPELGDQRKATISDKEFRTLLRAELLVSSYKHGENKDQLFRAASVSQFRTILRGCAYALKKVDNLDKEFAKFNRARREADKPEISFTSPVDISDQFEELKEFTPRIVTRSITTQERAMSLEEEIDPLLPIPLRELGKRLGDIDFSIFGARRPIDSTLKRIVREASVGLYLEDDRKVILHIAPTIAELFAGSDPDLKDDLRRARKVASSPLVVSLNLPYRTKPVLESNYFLPADVISIRGISSSFKTFHDEQLHRTSLCESLNSKLKTYMNASFYRGGFKDRRMSLEMMPSEELFGEIKEAPLKSFRYRSPRELKEKLVALEEGIKKGEFVEASTLDEAWFSKAKLACSRGGAQRWRYEACDRETWSTMNRLSALNKVYFSREFVDAVKNIERLAASSTQMPIRMEGVVGLKQRFVWREGQLIVNYSQAQRGNSILDVAFENERFLSVWAQAQEWLEQYAKDIGKKAVEIVLREFPPIDFPRLKGKSLPSDPDLKASLNRELAEYIAENWRRWYPTS